MRLSYLIRAHHAPELLERLVRRLSTESTDFFIHVNSRTDPDTYEEMVSRLHNVASVTWLPRVDCYYGGFSLVRATLTGIGAIAQEEPLPDYVVLLSGQDYPLKPGREIEAFFGGQNDRNLLHHFALPSTNWPGENGGLDRIQYRYFEKVRVRTRLLRIPLLKRTLPAGYQPFGGSAFWALTGSCIRYVDEFVRKNPRFVSFFKSTKIPCELFFHTLLLNSPLAPTIENDQLHYVDWSAGGAHPATLREADFEALVASGKLFARKFDLTQDRAILDLLDREVLLVANRTP